MLVFIVKKYVCEFLSAWVVLLLLNSTVFHVTGFGYTYLDQMLSFFALLFLASFATGYIFFLLLLALALILFGEVSDYRKKMFVLICSSSYLIFAAWAQGVFDFSMANYEFPLICFFSFLAVNFFFAIVTHQRVSN